MRKFDKGQSRTPWGKVKNMIHLRRENNRRQPPRGSLRSEDGYSISSLESSEILQEVITIIIQKQINDYFNNITAGKYRHIPFFIFYRINFKLLESSLTPSPLLNRY